MWRQVTMVVLKLPYKAMRTGRILPSRRKKRSVINLDEGARGGTIETTPHLTYRCEACTYRSIGSCECHSLQQSRAGRTLDGHFTFGMRVDPASQKVDVEDASGSMRIDLKHLPVAETGRIFKHIHATLSAEKDGLKIGPMTILNPMLGAREAPYHDRKVRVGWL